MTKARELRSAGDIVGALKLRHGMRKLLFRGQVVDRPLLPKIARFGESIDPSRLEDMEREMLDRFRKESLPFINGPRPQTDWDWLSVAQHQGLPTRLLDWTANALAALWFAVSENPSDDETHGVVWVLEVSPSDMKSPSEGTDIFNLTRTYVFQPFHIDRRIAAQSGWFSVHRYTERKQKFIALDQNILYKGRLSKFHVPRASFKKIRRELRLMGVTQATMFPDLSGLCSDIESDVLGRRRPLETI